MDVISKEEMLTRTEKNRIRRKKNKAKNREIIHSIRQETPCAVCGQYCFAFYTDFHHCYGKKRYNIAKMTNARRKTLWREIWKCAIVCVRCHLLIHQDKIKPILQPISTRGCYE